MVIESAGLDDLHTVLIMPIVRLLVPSPIANMNNVSIRIKMKKSSEDTDISTSVTLDLEL